MTENCSVTGAKLVRLSDMGSDLSDGSQPESSQLVETVLDKVSDALIAGENVKISSFGSFILRDKNRRIGRNPKTGEEVPIEPRRVLTFRPSQILRERINEGA